MNFVDKKCHRKQKNQDLPDPKNEAQAEKAVRPPLAFENACVYRGSSTGGLVWRPPFDLP